MEAVAHRLTSRLPVAGQDISSNFRPGDACALSAGDQTRHIEAFLGARELRFGGVVVDPRVVSANYPDLEALASGAGSITLLLEAAAPTRHRGTARRGHLGVRADADGGAEQRDAGRRLPG